MMMMTLRMVMTRRTTTTGMTTRLTVTTVARQRVRTQETMLTGTTQRTVMRRSRANPLALPRKRQTRKRADEYYPCLLALVISILCPVLLPLALFFFFFFFFFLPF